MPRYDRVHCCCIRGQKEGESRIIVATALISSVAGCPETLPNGLGNLLSPTPSPVGKTWFAELVQQQAAMLQTRQDWGSRS
jgi:hypothetical protein